MKRFAIIGALVVAATGIGYAVFTFRQYEKETDARITSLEAQATEAMQLAKEEAVAASSASVHATEAASRAEVAAGARTTAEQQRDQAQAAQSQAESNAREASEQASRAKSDLEALRKQREEELDQMQQALSRVAETKRTPNGMIVILPDSTFKFDFDSAELRPHNRELLSRVAGILLASKGFGLSVFGYTDDVGTEEYNQGLSERRASAVRDYLVQAGIDAAIVNAKGFGKTNPRVNGQNQQARATNRRVEIAVTDSEIKYTGLSPQ